MRIYCDIMPKDDGGWGGSRDYGLPVIDCRVTKCPCNARGKCCMPSQISIGPDGACEFGKKALSPTEGGEQG